MNYSPRDKEQPLPVTDSRGWRMAIVSDGNAVKDLSQQDFQMLSTA